MLSSSGTHSTILTQSCDAGTTGRQSSATFFAERLNEVKKPKDSSVEIYMSTYAEMKGRLFTS
jgi:hypothetical protein